MMRLATRKQGGGLVLSILGVAVLAPAVIAAGGGVRPAGPGGAPHPGYLVLARQCFKCHGDGTAQSGLDLRTHASLTAGGKHGSALVAGKPEASRLLRVLTGAVKPQMPPTGALSDRDVQSVRAWLAAGAPYPPREKNTDSRWWSFRPVQRPAVPLTREPWVRTPVDGFVLARLKSAGLRPNPPASRTTLLRRLTFDLHGLPPTPDEIAAFLADRRPDAYERVVDRLLASPRYGERWARHWLDLARYAESEGFKADETRPNAWRYRDYVIQSFNEDKPYDQFLREQLAGDEIAPDEPQALVATGFNRHWADESNARNISLRRQEILNDITDTTSSVMLGLTISCARCHDHKYDPISQKEYYRLQAFFAAVQPRDDLPLVSPQAREAHARRLAEWTERTRDVGSRLAALEAGPRTRLVAQKRMPFTPEVQDAIDTAPARRTALQWQLFLKVQPQIEISDDEVGKAMPTAERKQWEALRKELAQFEPMRPADLPVAQGVTDVGSQAPKTWTLAGGVYDQPVEEVQPGFPAAVGGNARPVNAPAARSSTGRRTALADWVASPANPLTARVMVNRVWQYHFGTGIVATGSDFGKTGEAPSHPELLDWLASAFTSGEYGDVSTVANTETAKRTQSGRMAWSLKRLHRSIVLSSTYQQSSDPTPASTAVDPENRLIWRFATRRLEGEAIRDACLAASGQLNLKQGGPGIFPELPPGVVTRGGWTLTPDEAERNRRSVYVFVRRNMRYPLFEAFDFPDTHEPCSRRSVTNTAPQSLMLFNSELALKPAQAMAGRLLRECTTLEARITRAYWLAFGRAPDSEERELSLRFLERQSAVVAGRLSRREQVALPTGGTGAVTEAEGAALVDFCHGLMNANEFIYVD